MNATSTEILEQLKGLSEQERNHLIRAGLYEAAHARVRQLQDEIAECEAHIRGFEERYGVSFEQFENDVLSQSESLTVHEDYNDWFYWEQVLAEKKQILAELSHIERA